VKRLHPHLIGAAVQIGSGSIDLLIELLIELLIHLSLEFGT